MPGPSINLDETSQLRGGTWQGDGGVNWVSVAERGLRLYKMAIMKIVRRPHQDTAGIIL